MGKLVDLGQRKIQGHAANGQRSTVDSRVLLRLGLESILRTWYLVLGTSCIQMLLMKVLGTLYFVLYTVNG